MNSKRCVVTAEDTKGRTVTGLISTTALDRDGDVLLPSGLDAREFKKNPVVLFGHDSGRLPIGKATKLSTTTSAVSASVEFASRPAEHPDAAEWVPDTIHALFKQGILNAFSVGFTVPENGMREAGDLDRKRFGKGVRRVISKWKLLEFSVVPIPSNQDALATAVSKGLHLDDWTAEQLDYHEAVVAESIERRTLTLEQPAPLEVRLPIRIGW